jgi:large subunit ribosomal protein L25
VLTGDAGLHAILDVVIEDQETTHPSILKEYQHDPMRGKLVHVDLQEVRLDQPIQAVVSVSLVGAEDAPGVREGGALSQVNREINVEALPMEIPEHIDLDVSGMVIGDTLRVSDLRAIDGVTFLDDPETVLASLAIPTRVEEPEVEEAEEEAAEGEEGAEGEAPAEEAPEAAAEGESGEPGSTEG